MEQNNGKNTTTSLQTLFQPESIAILGVSTRNMHFGGSSFLTRLKQSGFQGRIYPINPGADSIQGFKCFPDLESLPETPDLVMVSIPSQHVPATLEKCGQLGMRNIHILTSGFREIGTTEGIALENQVATISNQYGLRVVGPNCMGPYCPSVGLTAWGAVPGLAGPIGVISQSGGITQRFTEMACSLGVGISKAVSIGNATVLDTCDYLEFMGNDSSVSVIAIYLENTTDGRQLVHVVREVNKRKPVIILKGGDSDAGNRTIASHTGAMAGNRQIWEAFFQQTGVIRVRSLEEWVDSAITLSLLPDRKVDNGVFLATGGGGNSAIYSDIFIGEGLQVPELSPQSMQQIREKVPAIGSIAGNPLDSFQIYSNMEHMAEISQIVLGDPAISMLAVDRLIPRKAYHLPDFPDQARKTINVLQPVSRLRPVVVIVDSDGGDSELAAEGTQIRRTFCENGIPAFPSATRAARALSHYSRYRGKN